jgi:hypothetical protein
MIVFECLDTDLNVMKSWFGHLLDSESTVFSFFEPWGIHCLLVRVLWTWRGCVACLCELFVYDVLRFFVKQNSDILQLISFEMLIMQKKWNCYEWSLHICHLFQRPVDTWDNILVISVSYKTSLRNFDFGFDTWELDSCTFILFVTDFTFFNIYSPVLV